MKRYVIQLIVNEGTDEFWESIKGTGCDEILYDIKELFDNTGYDVEVKLVEFSDK